jgi:hypothetical protein
MKFRSVLLGGLLAGTLFVAGSGEASANVAWCISDPPILVVTPGGHYIVVNNMVYLPPQALHLKNRITDDASATSNGRGGTLVTVHVHVPATAGRAHVISSENRFRLSAQQDGQTTITLYLDVPLT